MNVQGPVQRTSSSIYPIPMQEFNSALIELSSQSPQWYLANYGDACGICIQSYASRQFLLTLLDHMMRLQSCGQDFSTPLVMLAATMLQTGYEIGRKRAEAEILEGWMRL
jgi:hypothetical protein